MEAAVGGKLGQIGGRLINASARKMADEFFQALNEQLAPQASRQTLPEAAPAMVAVGEHAAPSHSAPSPVAVPLAGGPIWASELQRILWLVIGIGVGWVACRAFS